MQFQPKKMLSTWSFVLTFWLCFFSFNHNPLAKTTIVVTYDVSGSMYTINSSQQEFFLSAGEFRSLAEVVDYLVFEGDPALNQMFSSIRGGTFLTNVQSRSKDTRGPFYMKGSRVFYYEYAEYNHLKYDSLKKNHSDQEIRQALVENMPYPKDIPPSARMRVESGVVGSFRKAFPGNASLQDYAELTAFRKFDEMVRSGDEAPIVVWVRVSDEDMDTTELVRFQRIADQLKGELFAHKKVYEKAKLEELYQVKVGGRAWLRVHRIAFLEPSDLEKARVEAEKLQKQIEDYRVKIEKLEKEISRIHDLENKAYNLELIVANERVQSETVDTRLRFNRKKASSQSKEKRQTRRVFVTDKLRLVAGKGTVDADFSISTANLEVLDSGASPLAGHSYQFAELEVGKALGIQMPDSEELRLKGKKAILKVDYKFLPSDEKLLSKTWILNDVDFPDPGPFEKFWWLIPLFGILVAVTLVLLMRSSGGRQLDSEDDEVKEGLDVFGNGERFSEKSSGWFEASVASEEGIQKYQGSEIETTRRDKGPGSYIHLFTDTHRADFKEISENQSVLLSSEEADFWEQDRVWDLNCPGHRLEYRNGVLFLNGKEISSDTFSVKNMVGDNIIIRIKRNK